MKALRRLLATVLLVGAGVVGLLIVGIEAGAGAQERSPAPPDDPPVLAHYYIWFEAGSWNRAKTDYPALGRYSSDQESVMRRHVEQAQEAGIDGFIVSWKSTEVLDPRLEMLIDIAEERDFGLAVTYQGLDFNRDPLPVSRVEQDLELFVERYARRRPFEVFDRPVVVLTGTWKFSADEIGRLANSVRGEVQLLATERNVDGYRRVAEHVDGNLYYWSSVDPETFPGYPTKLVEMGEAVRANGQLWIAPAAPGFDARLVGGTTVVGRDDGRTLRRQWNGAISSLPDAIGLISWNEFSENTHVEPSERFGNRYLGVVAELTGAPRIELLTFGSSTPPTTTDASEGWIRLFALACFVALVAGSGLLIVRRQGIARSAPVP